MDVIIKSKNNKLSIIIFIIILLFSCKIKKITKLDIKKNNLPDIILKKYEHYIYKNKKKYLYANINNAEFYEKEFKIYCDKIFAEIYDSDGELITVVNSDKGVIDKEEKILTFIGNVYIEILENNAKLHSDELKLDYENNRLISDKEILLEKKDGSYIKADSMESDLKLESTRFENMQIKYYYDEEKK